MNSPDGGGFVIPKKRPDRQLFIATVNTVFTDFEIDYINREIKEYPDELRAGKVGDNTLIKSVRDSEVAWLKVGQNAWIYEKVWQAVKLANETWWQFDILHNTPRLGNAMQYTVYSSEEEGHYDWHMDMGTDATWNRKLTYSIQMSNPSEYEGGILTLQSHGMDTKTAKKKKGTMTIFPSFLRHRVTPVTEGTRRSLVGWVGGPAWR